MSAPSPTAYRETLLRWLLACLLFATLMLVFSPSWGAFRLAALVPELRGMIEVRRGVSVLAQVDHPGAPIADSLHGAIQWRLLFPLVGHFLNLSPPVFFALPYLGCLLLLGFLVSLLRANHATWTNTTLVGLSLGAASWFFTSTGWLGYFDAWLALSLLLAAFARTHSALWFACLWGPWVDERFVLALPLALLCRYLRTQRRPAPAKALDGTREFGVPAALAFIFLVARLGVLPRYSASGATMSGYLHGRNILDAPPSRIALGVWEGLRSGWLFVVIALWSLRRPTPLHPVDPTAGKPRVRGAAKSSWLPASLLGAAVVVIAFVGLATAQDYSRSMTLLLPAAVLGALLKANSARVWSPRILPAAAIGALLLPAHQVMNDRVNPIFYLYHELAGLDHPPPSGMPELYELRAIHEMERGEFPQADADLALAMKLAPNPASPSKQRGILAASERRWADALRYFSITAEYDAQNPEAWFMCAQAQLALNDPTAAQTSFQRALALAPAGWAARPDVARFTATLNKR